jgi:hypothetical protein
MKDVLHADIARRAGVFDPWGLVRAVVVRLLRLDRPRRIEVTPMSESWLLEHERESGQRPDY